MARIISARKMKDKMPRWLWEMRTDCGHFHYELVETYPQQPAHVVCRVCAAHERSRKYIATLSGEQLERIRSHPILSQYIPERGQRAPEPDGVAPIPPAQQEEGTKWAHQDGQKAADPPAARTELPSCMRPRPGAPEPRPVPGLDPEPPPVIGKVERGALTARQAKAGRRRRKRGPDPDQTSLFA